MAEIKQVRKQGQQTRTNLLDGSIGFLPIYNSEFNFIEPNQTPNNNNVGYYYQYPFYYTQQSL